MHEKASGETPPIQQAGITLDKVSRLARLGMVLEATRVTEARGRSEPEAVFTFIPDSPLGRANIACDTDVDIFDGIIGDAEQLNYDEFAVRFPKFGPYDS